MAETGAEPLSERRTELVVCALLLVYTAASLTGADMPVGQLVAGVGVTVVALGSVLLRRTHPRSSVTVLAVATGVGYALQLPSQLLIWTVVGFALVLTRSGRTALIWWAGLGVTLASFAGFWLLTGRFAMAIGYGLAIGLQALFYTAVGVLLGTVARALREREDRLRRADETATTATALDTQRTRIADELGSGVLDGLRRLTAATDALDPSSTRTGPVLTALERDARDVLTRMRRTLAALRERIPSDGRATPDRVEPGRRRPPWLPSPSGLAIAAVFGLLAIGMYALRGRPIGQAAVDRYLPLFDIPWSTPVALASLAVQLLAVGWWRSAPASAFVVATAAALTTGTLGATNGVVEVSWFVMVYGMAVGAPALRSAPLAAVGTLAVLVAYLTVPVITARVPAGTLQIVLAFLVVPVLWYAGYRRRGHRLSDERRRRALHDAERHEVLEAQRLRIARDLHDVVAHHVSAVVVQAGAARITTDTDTRREALAHIRDSGARIADALPELEGLTPDPGGVALTGAGLADLVRPARDAGVPVTTEVVGDPADPPGDPELFAQRILTEALTNVVRYAGPSPTHVRLEHAPDAVRVRVVDAGPADGHGSQTAGSGLGLVGMRERAGLLGGLVESGTGDDGGWCVRALLPRRDGTPPRGGDAADDLVRADDAAHPAGS